MEVCLQKYSLSACDFFLSAKYMQYLETYFHIMGRGLLSVHADCEDSHLRILRLEEHRSGLKVR